MLKIRMATEDLGLEVVDFPVLMHIICTTVTTMVRMIEKVFLAPGFAFLDAEAPHWAFRPGLHESMKNAWFLGPVTPYIAGG